MSTQTAASIALRPYQVQAVNAIVSEFKAGNRSTLLVLATGLGKTVVFSSLAARAKGRVLVLAHRDELIQQAHSKLCAAAPGKNVGIVKARVREWDRHIIVASVQSLTARHFATIPADISLVITDESHHAYAAGYQAIYQHLKAGESGGPYHLGVTATPNRADGKGLASVFQSVAYEYGLFDAIEDGWLCKLRALRIRTGVNLQGVSTKHGDFAAGELEDAVNTANRNELCVKAWKEHASDRQTVCFTAGVKHAYDLAEAFRAEGVPAAALCGETPTEDRRGLLAGLSSGVIRVLCNASVLTEGFDEPSLRCIMLAKPTKSESLYIQMVGRSTRLHPGKEDALILDLSDNAGRHRLVQLADLDGAERAKRDGVIEIQEERGEGSAEAEEAPVGEGIHAEVVDLGRAGKREKEPKVVLEWKPEWFDAPDAICYSEVAEIDGLRIHAVCDQSDASGAWRQWLMLSFWWATRSTWTRPIDALSNLYGCAPIYDRDAAEMELRVLGQLLAEEFAKKGRFAIDPAAPWRKKPASDAQRAYAERCEPGCSRRNAPLALTAGEASDIITLYRARKRLQKQERKAIHA